MPQNIRIALIADDKTQAAKKGVDDLDKKIDALGKSWKEAGEASEASGKKMTSSASNAEKSMASLGNTAKTIGGVIAAAFTVNALFDVGKRVIAVTSEFQKFSAVLTLTLGSNVAAQIAMQKVADVAAKTNFSVKELTDSYVKFANRGIKLTASELTKLSDIANTTGKSFDQLTEAVLDALTGQNERLREFGIVAQKTGETTQYTFKGVTTEVKNTDEAIKAYLLSLGDLDGVVGATAAISKTLSGQISNFGDALDQLFVTIGQGVNGPFSGLISAFTSYVQWVTNALKTTQQFQDEISNIRADKFIQSFEKMDEAVQKATVQRLHLYIDAQAELLIMERKAREKAQQEANEAYIGEAGIAIEIEKSAREKELELTLQTNIKKLELIKVFYADKAKETDKGEDKLTDKEKKALEKRLKEEREHWEKRRALGRKQLEELQKTVEEMSISALESRNAAEKAEAEKEKNRIDRMKKEGKDALDFADAQNKEKERQEKEHWEKMNAIREAAFDVGHQFVDALFEIGRDRNQAALEESSRKRDEELKRVGENKQAQAFINAKFDREEAKLKTKQAIADKANILFGIGINTALAATKAVAASPATFGQPFLTFALVLGAIQAAVAAARPIPKFATGTEYLNGKGGTDSNLIYADTGERIVPKTINRAMLGIKNSELPSLAAMYRAEPMARAELREMIRAQKETTTAIRQIKVERTHITERGLQRVVEQGNTKSKILNDQFSF